MVSLRLADTFGFDALYMTGFGTVASHLGLPDAGLATYSDMLGRVTAMAAMARDAADRRCRYGLWRTAEPAPHGARLRSGGRGGDPARRSGVSEEVRAHARPSRDPDERHGREDSRRDRFAQLAGLPRHRTHRCALCFGTRRSAASRRSLRACRRRRPVRRVARVGRRDARASAARSICRWWPTWSRKAARRC